MKFCSCGSIMTKTITAQQEIIFLCICGNSAEAAPEDCLMYEEILLRSTDPAKYEIMIENSPHDSARFLVAKPCPDCKLDRMTQVFIQGSMQTFYICECGYRSAHT